MTPARLFALATLVATMGCFPDFPEKAHRGDAGTDDGGAVAPDGRLDTAGLPLPADARSEADAADVPARADAGADAPSGACVPACTVSETRCGPNGGRQTCTTESGCAAWGPEASCGDLRVCRAQGTTTSCACKEEPSTVTCTTGTTFCSADRSAVYRCREANGCKARETIDTCHPAAACAGAGNAVSCRQVSVGQGFACAMWDSKVRCWGTNEHGELGTGSTGPDIGDDEHPKANPLISFGDEKPAMISAGYLNACALMKSGKVMCWGENNNGRLGIDESGAIGVIKPPTVVVGVAKANHVVTEDSRACAALDGGGVSCWGINDNADSFPPKNTLTPTRVEAVGDRKASQVELGITHACALVDGGQVLCWGTMENRLGVGDQKPFASLGGATAKKVAVGRNHTCVLIGDRLRCWGLDRQGSLGNGPAAGDQTLPQETVGLTDIVDVSASMQTCAIDSSGHLLCWGSNTDGQVGTSQSVGAVESPLEVSGLDYTAIRVSAGLESTCVLRTTGAIHCWGANYRGQVGVASTEQKVPVPGSPVQYE